VAYLKSEIKKITVSLPQSFLKELDKHLDKFATDRSQWLMEAAKELMIKEKMMLSEIEQNKKLNEDN
jgi:metal-responsive CopG/Arc/MetJ family transcriptional regulator